MKLKIRELEKLKEKLPRRYRMILWKRTNASLSAIDSVLRGNYNNPIIIDAAIELAEEHQNSLKERSEKISNL